MKRTAPLLAMFGLSLLLLAPTYGQNQQPALDARILDAFAPRCIGPANMGGRVTDVAAVESDPKVIYVATASGGLWKTEDAGDSWRPLFDEQPTSWIGAVAVSPSHPNVVWVGTGESNPRNSVSWGDGVYKSTDGGKTWKNMGLKETHHIGRVVIHPTNPDIVYVAALGHLWGKNKERGLYKTSDGGKTWELSKFIDDETGFIDVTMDPTAPEVLYAAAYRVRRDPFSGGNPAVQLGKGAGLYRTTDGGKSWERMTNGLPKGTYGRCGLSVYRKDPRVVFAVVQGSQTSVTVQGGAANKGLDLEAGGVFRSDDRGATWKHVNSLCPRPFYYGQIRVDPSDDKRVYVLGIQFHVSDDGGKTFRNQPMKGVHVDHHALWINPQDSKQLVLGNDGGLYFSKDRAVSWEHIRGMALGQFYAIAVDTRTPYRVYGGLQDNGSWGGPSATYSKTGITLNDWRKVGGGDGFYCAVDPEDPNTVYVESQYGRPVRLNLKAAAGGKKGGGGKSIAPAGKAKGGGGYRFNWSSPFILSPHNPKTIYYGGNVLFQSNDRGDTWKAISPDLTRAKLGQKSTGNTLTTISESPLKAGLIYVGADDGKVHVTRDGGTTWDDLSDHLPGVPPNRWITRVECSPHDEATAYLSLTRYRNDDRRAYVFKTTDHGKTWKSIVSNLPEHGPVHVIKESSRRKDLLFVGTEYALFVSLDGGGRWDRIGKGFPTVPVHDLVIHPRDRDLVIGTHGRSVWVMDVGPLEQLTPKVLAADAHLFDVRPAVAFTMKDAPAPVGRKVFAGENPPYGAVIHYYLKSDLERPAEVVISDGAGKELAKLTGTNRAGLHRVVWDLRARGDEGGTVPPGEYTARLHAGGQMLTRSVRVDAP